MTQATAMRTGYKAWAREHVKGVEGVVHPSFSADFKTLDEAGIRRDVRQSIAQGVFSIFTSAAGLTHDEYKDILAVVRDEAGDEALTSAVVRDHDMAKCFDLIKHAEKIGCSHVLLWLPDPPATAEAMIKQYSALIASADIAIFLYVHRLPAYRAMHPSGVAFPVLDALANLPSVVAAKITQTMDPVAALEACALLSDRLLLGPADLSLIPVLARLYPIQWTGQFLIEAMQSVDKPYLTQFMAALNAGDMNAATEIYWTFRAASRAFNDLQREFLLRGSHPWTHLKYHQWLTGGNGGLLRRMHDEDVPLDAAWRDTIAKSLKSAGIPLHDRPLDEFIVGAENYKRGIRPADLPRATLLGGMTVRFRRFIALAVFAALALTSAPQARAADPIVIRVGTLAADAAAQPFYAEEMGFFKAAGLDVQISVMPTGAALTSAVASGALDVAAATISVAAVAHARHIPVHLIASASLYVGSPASSAIMVSKDSTAKTGADLNGKTVAVIGLKDVSQFSTAAWIDQNGGDSKTVKFIEIPTVQMTSALQQHRVDAALMPEPFLTISRATSRELGNAQGALGTKYLLIGWLANDAWIAANGPAVRAYAGAMRQAADWANKHPDESTAILLKNSKLSPDVAKTMARATYDATPLNAALIQPIIDAAAKYGMIEKAFPGQELIAAVPR